MVKFKPRQQTTHIVVHCSATPPSRDVGVRDVRAWHKQLGWLDVGYHYVIRRDGTVEAGRPDDVVGSHVMGYNDKSVGICLVGGLSDITKKPEANYTPEQMGALYSLLLKLQMLKYPDTAVVGHNDLNGYKECPCFDVKTWYDSYVPPTA